MNQTFSKHHTTPTKEIISYFLKYPDYFLKNIAMHYPFDVPTLLKSADILDWSSISCNTQIKWNASLIEKCKSRIDWNMFSSNPSAFQDIHLLDKYSNYLDWKGDVQYRWGAVVWNSGLPWGTPFIDKYKSRFSFKTLAASECIPWDWNLIKRYKHLWDFELLAMNPTIQWDAKHFEQYYDKSIFDIDAVACNPGMLCDFELIMLYAVNVCWYSISANSKLFCIDDDLLDLWDDCLEWSGIARNEALAQHYPDFLNRFMHRWMKEPEASFEGLSANPALKWTPQLIEEYVDVWDWEALSLNEGIPWSKTLINRYKDKISWGALTPIWKCNDLPEIDPDKVQEVLDPGLVCNKAIPWSIDLLKTFEDHIQSRAIEGNKSIWKKAFEPYVNQELMDLVLRII